MSQEHLDRLTAIDASFLHQEGPTSHMHVGAADDRSRGRRRPSPRCWTRCAGACTSCRATARSSRCRRPGPAGRCGSTTRASTSSTTCATPRCRDPGSEEQLLLLAGRIFSQQLDRSKPLWEVWMVEGLEDGGFALITKTHHALIDGDRGRRHRPGDLRPRPRARPRCPHPDEAVGARARADRRAAARPSGTLGLVRTGVRTAAARGGARHAPGRGAALGARGRRGPRRGRVGGPEPGAPDAAERRDRPAPALPRACATSSPTSRRSRTPSAARSTTSCSPSSAARCARGCTRAACAPRAWSCARSCRSRSAPSDERGTTGNRIAAMRGPLPVYVEDPVVRLRDGQGRRWTA